MIALLTTLFLLFVALLVIFIKIALCLLGIVIYCLPTIIALIKDHKDKVLIIFLNIIFGWSVVGWIIALMLAVTRRS